MVVNKHELITMETNGLETLRAALVTADPDARHDGRLARMRESPEAIIACATEFIRSKMKRSRYFQYQALPLEQIAKEYKGGASWTQLARKYGCPDHKSLKRHVLFAYPWLKPRTPQEQQAIRRAQGKKLTAVEKMSREELASIYNPYIGHG